MVTPEPERYVKPVAAHKYWAKHAYEVLVETAGRYNAVITHAELAEEVQRRSNLWTKAPVGSWVNTLLVDLARVSQLRGEPALTSLVVRTQDGQVGAGYDEVLRVTGSGPIDDPMERELHAATARLECYRHWGADVPQDASPTLPGRMQEGTRPRPSGPAAAAAGKAGAPTSRAAAEPRRGRVCPTCFMEMPVAGPCPNCAD
jgi:hypothetical protein